MTDLSENPLPKLSKKHIRADDEKRFQVLQSLKSSKNPIIDCTNRPKLAVGGVDDKNYFSFRILHD
jgi:hypothetical protein